MRCSRVALVLADLPGAEGFALGGGAALIVRGAVERETHDLDFFVGEADSVDRLLPALESALIASHLVVERRQVAHGFARLSVRGDDDHTEIDLCVDYRLLPAEPSAIGPVLSLEELAANKLLALFRPSRGPRLRRFRRIGTHLRSRSSLRACDREGRWLR